MGKKELPEKARFEELMKEGYLEMAEENREWAKMVWPLACEAVNGNI